MSRIGLFVAGIVVGAAVTTGVAEIELAELTPESLQRKAIDSWK